MAELCDWLNRWCVRLTQMQGVNHLQVIHQHKVFIDNQRGWEMQTLAKSCWPSFPLNQANVEDFVMSVRAWLGLPLAQFKQTYFGGQWNFANKGATFMLELGPFKDTPSKVDWFTARVHIAHGEIEWCGELQLDCS